ncbi:MAG: tetratricopeptide repeat protein [Thermoplasmata archaeon]|nr:tetratricopeptide repeat protein [Thermoplasmata archaeon]
MKQEAVSSSDRVHLYIGMIESVLKSNRDVIGPDRASLILETVSGKHVIMEKVSISDDFSFTADGGGVDLPDEPPTMFALRDFLERYFLSLTDRVGEDEAVQRIRKPARNFITSNWSEVLSTRMDWHLPLLPLSLFKKNRPGWEEEPLGQQGRYLFETLFSSYITDFAQTVTLSTFRKKLATLARSLPSASAIRIGDDGTVEIPIPVANRRVIREMGMVFNSFVDLSAFALGDEGALGKARMIGGPVLSYFSQAAKKLPGIEEILHGMITPSAPTHIKGLDAALGGGFPKGGLLLFQVPGGVERGLVFDHLVRDAISTRGPVVLVLSSRFPHTLRSQMISWGIDVEAEEKKRRMVFVDWYSHKNERIVGVEASGNVVKTGKDLTNLEIALDKATSMAKRRPVQRILVESLSPVLKGFDEKSTSSFLQSLRTRVAKNKGVAVVVVEKEMHDQRLLTSVHSIFDGVVDIYKTEQGLALRVLSMKGRNIKTSPRTLVLSGQEMSAALLKGEKELSDSDMEILLQRAGVGGGEKKEKAAARGPDERPVKEGAGVKRPEPGSTKPVGDRLSKEEHYKKGVLLASRREYEEARREFQKAIDMDPLYIDAIQALGSMLLYGVGDMEGAVEFLEKAANVDPENADAWFDLGSAYYRMGDMEQAKKAFMKANSIRQVYKWYDKKEFLCPGCSEILAVGTRTCPSCGVRLDALGQIVSAPEEAGGEVADVEMRVAEVGEAVGEAGGLDGAVDLDEAGEAGEEEVVEVPALEEAGEEAPVEGETLFLCPVCGSVVRETDVQCPNCKAVFEATMEEEETAEMEEEGPAADPALVLREAYESGDLDFVISTAEEMLRGDMNEDAVIYKGMALTDKRRLKEALVFYKTVLKRDMKMYGVLAGVSYTLLKMNKLVEAEKYARNCLAKSPGNFLARRVLDEVKRRMGG